MLRPQACVWMTALIRPVFSCAQCGRSVTTWLKVVRWVIRRFVSIAPEAIEAATTIPSEAREMLTLLGQEIDHLDTRLEEIEVKLTAAHKANALSQRLATIPGVGRIIALTLAIEVDPMAFESGRHLAKPAAPRSCRRLSRRPQSS